MAVKKVILPTIFNNSAINIKDLFIIHLDFFPDNLDNFNDGKRKGH